MELKPIVFMQGDQGAGRVAEIIKKVMFSDFPTVDVPLTLQARIASLDTCIDDAATALLKLQSGLKISTATDDDDIRRLKLGSANIKLRNKLNLIGIERINSLPGNYLHPCGVFRFGSGGIYGEKSCLLLVRDGQEFATITQEVNVTNYKHFAICAMQIAKTHGLHLVLGTKQTISHSERLMFERITAVWKNAGLIEGDSWSSEFGWKNDWHHQLTDDLMADLPVKNGERVNPYEYGKFLVLLNNEKGDDASDLVDRQDGRRIMTSKLHCLVDGNHFTYEELPGGTATRMATGALVRDNFFNPAGMIFAFCSAFEQVNPDQKLFFDSLRAETLDYLTNTSKEDRDTEVMIQQIAEKSLPYLVTE